MELPEDLKWVIWKSYYGNHVLNEMLYVYPKTKMLIELLRVTTKVNQSNIWLPIACRIHWLQRTYVV